MASFHFSGLILGLCTFVIIGVFHPITIRAEYYWGARCWPFFLVLGLAGVVASILVSQVLLSSLLGVFAFSSFWTIGELFEQEKRVSRGWFPRNPKREKKREKRAEGQE